MLLRGNIDIKSKIQLNSTFTLLLKRIRIGIIQGVSAIPRIMSFYTSVTPLEDQLINKNMNGSHTKVSEPWVDGPRSCLLATTFLPLLIKGTEAEQLIYHSTSMQLRRCQL